MMGKQNEQIQMVILDIDSMIPQDHLLRQIKEEVLRKLPDRKGYIFTRDGERLRERQVNYVLEKYAERIGAPTKSSHKLRKTYASRLDAAGVPLDAIRQDLGHKHLSTTLTYLFNSNSDEQTYKLKAQAI
ncbi:site-specific integrase [Lacrimispora sp. 210928-DFI.3.58]|uniref:site-specific integrase n=1 Tax=Lacrimispora sp. 210928-DFI.3.58 TaxID=2883214 RepID=UPI0015B59281|nr:site-specific integrase [Lacrimispora sp. 210928-DFI.3.58]MCB7320169.1 site-specific integrase [Lacrimispora sp. 210928-DFI.3.58]